MKSDRDAIEVLEGNGPVDIMMLSLIEISNHTPPLLANWERCFGRSTDRTRINWSGRAVERKPQAALYSIVNEGDFKRL